MTAPMILDGPINRVAFQAYIEQVQVPTLHRGDTVIMDNLPAHKGADAKLKSFLRKAAARTIDDLWDVIGNALPTFTPQDCANYFTVAGYVVRDHCLNRQKLEFPGFITMAGRSRHQDYAA